MKKFSLILTFWLVALFAFGQAQQQMSRLALTGNMNGNETNSLESLLNVLASGTVSASNFTGQLQDSPGLFNNQFPSNTTVLIAGGNSFNASPYLSPTNSDYYLTNYVGFRYYINSAISGYYINSLTNFANYYSMFGQYMTNAGWTYLIDLGNPINDVYFGLPPSVINADYDVICGYAHTNTLCRVIVMASSCGVNNGVTVGGGTIWTNNSEINGGARIQVNIGMEMDTNIDFLDPAGTYFPTPIEAPSLYVDLYAHPGAFLYNMQGLYKAALLDRNLRAIGAIRQVLAFFGSRQLNLQQGVNLLGQNSAIGWLMTGTNFNNGYGWTVGISYPNLTISSINQSFGTNTPVVTFQFGNSTGPGSGIGVNGYVTDTGHIVYGSESIATNLTVGGNGAFNLLTVQSSNLNADAEINIGPFPYTAGTNLSANYVGNPGDFVSDSLEGDGVVKLAGFGKFLRFGVGGGQSQEQISQSGVNFSGVSTNVGISYPLDGLVIGSSGQATINSTGQGSFPQVTVVSNSFFEQTNFANYGLFTNGLLTTPLNASQLTSGTVPLAQTARSTNYSAANFIPIAGSIILVASNNWMYSVTSLQTNRAFQISP
jgi:hypothetical protein